MTARGAATCLGALALASPLALSQPAAAFCSVFDRGPCTPAFCSVFEDGVCIPDYGFPVGQDLRLTIESRTPPPEKPDGDLDTIASLFRMLRACWEPPQQDRARAGMEVSVRLSFKRSGEMISAPRWTYTTPSVGDEARKLYRDAVTASLARCAPLHFTKGMAGAIAGRPIAIRYVDNRDMTQEPRP
jgi:hypothetical protein